MIASVYFSGLELIDAHLIIIIFSLNEFKHRHCIYIWPRCSCSAMNCPGFGIFGAIKDERKVLLVTSTPQLGIT